MNNSTPKTVVVDSDALIALFNKDDSNFSKSEGLFQTLLEEKVRIIYPSTVLVETVDTIQRRLKKHDEAAQIVKLIAQAQFTAESIEAVDSAYLKEAADLFNSGGSGTRKTLADCVVMAVTEKHNADAIFSFDEGYSKQGFKLVSKLFQI